MLLRGKRRPLKPNHTQILVFYFSPPLSPFFCISHVTIKFYANISMQIYMVIMKIIMENTN